MFMAEIENIQYIISSDGVKHPLDAIYFGGKTSDEYQEKNLVTKVDEKSTNYQYPSAKCLFDIVGDLKI